MASCGLAIVLGLFATLIGTPAAGQVATITGRVVGVSDGDTLTVLDDRQQQIKVRLAEIDAPEKKQPFGARSKQSLSELCFQKRAVLRVVDRDRYGRTVARLMCDGIDANASQVRHGMAWVFDRYAPDPALYQLQSAAKEAHSGLWADPAPRPPWEWRRKSRSARSEALQ